MRDESAPLNEAPDSTAARVALWRALHVSVDAEPHVLEDEVGLRLLAPDQGWRGRPDMDARFTRSFRASIVARARFIEDLAAEQSRQGASQLVLLGAGLDSLAQRRPDLAAALRIFEVDRPGPQAWKRRRLLETGLGLPPGLRFVPVDFEGDLSWREALVAAGFDPGLKSVVASTGVSMYLTPDAIAATLRQAAALAPGSTFAMTYLQPLDRADPEERPGFEASLKGARASGTPFLSFFTADQMLKEARKAGFKKTHCVRAVDLGRRYFAGRTDGLKPGSSEEILVATV